MKIKIYLVILLITTICKSYAQPTANVVFSVDMSVLVASGGFNAATDGVYLRSSFNSWSLGTPVPASTGNLYSVTVPLTKNQQFQYKYFITSLGAGNGGWENDFPGTFNRVINVGINDSILPTVYYNNIAPLVIAGVDSARLNAKIKVLRLHARIFGSPNFSTFKYPLKKLSAAVYQTQKPSDNFTFDAGFVGTNDTIYITEPITTDQQTVFSNLTDVALYYLCQSYMYHFYQTHNIPLIFKIGFPLFEAGLLPADNVIKTAVNNYGHPLSSFSVLNNPATFITNNNKGVALAGVFGEFLSVFKNWGYPLITNINANGFGVAPYWFNVDSLAGLLGDFNRYLYARFLQPNENLRVKMIQETAHFKFYTRPVDSTLNFPHIAVNSELNYSHYVTNFGVSHAEKVSYFTLPICIDGVLEGDTCDGIRLYGGTAWSSGIHLTCAGTASELWAFLNLGHELAHSFQGIFPQGTVTAWLNEGFPSFCDNGPITNLDSLVPNTGVSMRQAGITALNDATSYFGHRPTYEDTRIYPSPDYGYYTLGNLFVDYQYRRGGYQLIKDIQMNDVLAYQGLGYSSAQAFFDDFYFDFDVRLRHIPIVTLHNPVINVDETNSTVNIHWTPLKSNVPLNVSVSVNNTSSWTEIANHTSDTICVWNAGNISAQFYIKISAPDNLNISTVFGPFVKADLDSLNITAPMIDYAITNDTTEIKWATTNIQNVKIEYTLNNGGSWATISNSNSTSTCSYKWVIPTSLLGNCQVRISDITNTSLLSTSGTFKIVANNNVGGPYLLDSNTIALFHFDNDLHNRSYLSGNGSGNEANITANDGVITDLGNSFKPTSGVVTVPHCANLNLTGNWTIEAWVKLNSFTANTNMYMVNKPTNYALKVHPWLGNIFCGAYFYGSASSVYAGNMTPLLNEWYHVAFTRSGSVINVIVHDQDRNLISTATANYPNIPITSVQDLILGSGIDGYIDEVRISNVVRSFVVQTFNITAAANPANSGTITGAGSYNNGATCNLTATANNGYTFVNWTENGTPVSTSANYSFTVTSNRVLVANFTPITGIDVSGMNQISIYPNPSSGIITITGLPVNACSSVVIYANDGRELISKEINNTAESVIDISSLNPGIYYIVISGDKFMVTENIVRNANK